jgi:prevent-host-death family protein
MAIFQDMEISVAKAKDHFSQCLLRAQAGETVTIRKHGKPVAQITGIPDKPKNTIKFGSGRGTVKVFGDLTEPAFDPEDWECL